jgi:hypothetical protein
MEALGLRTTQYAGLLAVVGSRPDTALVSVHVDRHGLVCTGPGEFQYAAFIAQHKANATATPSRNKRFACCSNVSPARKCSHTSPGEAPTWAAAPFAMLNIVRGAAT